MPDSAVIQNRAAADMALRSRSGVFAYPVILAIIGAFTPYLTDHPRLFVSVSIILIAATIGRGICAFWFDRIYQFDPRLWRRVNRISVIGLALGWGILSMMSINYYGWQWTTMVTCLSAAAFSAGVVTTFSIDRHLVIGFLLVMFIPVLAGTAYTGTQESLTATFLFSVYLVFLLHIARRLNREYWLALHNIYLLDERARELESFAYSVSHDLRAPLRTIDGFSKILAEDAGSRLDKDEMQYLTRIRSAAQRMGNLIDDLLQLSRISRREFSPKPVNVTQLAHATIKKLQQLEPDRHVEVEIEPDMEAQADLTLLDLALENLLTNAWKFSSSRHRAKIRLATARVDGQKAYYVKDNGVGFDTRYEDKLFHPFQRLHHDKEFPGTGIGLSTVKRIIEKHGGRVWANAKLNKGATFYFTLNENTHYVSRESHPAMSIEKPNNERVSQQG